MEVIFAKSLRQINRLDKNKSKSVILDAKKECNRQIKKSIKTGNKISLKIYTEIKQQLLKILNNGN